MSEGKKKILFQFFNILTSLEHIENSVMYEKRGEITQHQLIPKNLKKSKILLS